MILKFAGLAGLLLASAFFSATETAFTSLSLGQVQEIIKTRKKAGKRVQFLTENPDILLTTILIGNNLVNILATAFATILTTELFGSQAIGIMTAILTIVVLIFAEVTPKRIAIAHNTGISVFTAPLIYVLGQLFRPLITVVTILSNFITNFFSSESQKNVSLDGILHLVNVAEDMGVVQEYEKHMVRSVFRFKGQSAGSIITHRTDTFMLEKETSIGSAVPLLLQEDYSRIPIYDKDPENIVGIALFRSIMREYQQKNTSRSIKDIMLPPLFIPENKKLSEVFELFKSQKLNMAVVLDEYGGFEGILTLEDLVEELFGDLHDEEEHKEMEKVIKLGAGFYKIAGDAPVMLVEDLMDIELQYSKNVQTITGYILELLDDLPRKGQIIETSEALFTVESMLRNKVLYITAKIKDHENQQ